MTSNRPFLSNFLAAFRAHSSILPKAAPSITTTSTSTTAQTVWSSTSNNLTSQSYTTSASPNTMSDARKIAPSQQHNRQPSPGPVSPTPLHPTLSAPLQHNVSPLTHAPRSPPSPGVGAVNGTPVYGPPNKPQPSYPTCQEARRRTRRGSDSSSDGGGGFRDVSRGGEKWYIGGRTAGGEERFYKLSMVRRERSADRLSADRLSL